MKLFKVHNQHLELNLVADWQLMWLFQNGQHIFPMYSIDMTLLWVSGTIPKVSWYNKKGISLQAPSGCPEDTRASKNMELSHTYCSLSATCPIHHSITVRKGKHPMEIKGQQV